MKFYTIYELAERITKDWNESCAAEEDYIRTGDEVGAKHEHNKVLKLENALDVLEDLALDDICSWFHEIKEKSDDLPF